MKIDEAPPLATLSGAEIVPVARSGAAASVTTAQIAALASFPALAALLAALAETSAAEEGETIPALRSGGEAVRLPLSALSALALAAWRDAGSEAGALSGADTLRLSQGGDARDAPLSAIASFVAGTLPASFAALSAATPLAADSVLLVRTSTGAPLLRRVTLADLAALLSSGSTAAESAPGVVVRSETETVYAADGDIELSFSLPAGSRLLALRAFVDTALSATDPESGEAVADLKPALHCGAAALEFATAYGSAAASLPARAVDGETFPFVNFGAGADGLEWTGAVRVSLTWEEPAALQPLVTTPEA